MRIHDFGYRRRPDIDACQPMAHLVSFRGGDKIAEHSVMMALDVEEALALFSEEPPLVSFLDDSYESSSKTP